MEYVSVVGLAVASTGATIALLGHIDKRREGRLQRAAERVLGAAKTGWAAWVHECRRAQGDTLVYELRLHFAEVAKRVAAGGVLVPAEGAARQAVADRLGSLPGVERATIEAGGYRVALRFDRADPKRLL